MQGLGPNSSIQPQPWSDLVHDAGGEVSGVLVKDCPPRRIASQGGSVDWMRFWLQGYEDPDPAEVEQYVRWRELRKLQITQDAERTDKESPRVH